MAGHHANRRAPGETEGRRARRAAALTRWLSAGLGLALLVSAAPAAQTRRALTLDDHSRIVTVGDPQRSPDGAWVAYTVSTIDAEKDRRNTDIWMVKWDGSEQLQLTSSPDSESSPRWSPIVPRRSRSSSSMARLPAQRAGPRW